MAHLFIDGEVEPDPALRGDALVLEILGQADQDGGGELVVQKTALDVALLRDPGPGIKADDVPHADAQLLHVVGGAYQLVQHHLGVVEVGDGLVQLPVHVGGGVAEQEGALVGAVELGDDPDVFGVGHHGGQTAQTGQTQPAGALDLGHHAAQGVAVGLQQQTVVGLLTAQIHQDAAFDGVDRRIAQVPEGLQQPLLCVRGITRGAVHRQQPDRLLHGIVGILFQIQHKNDPFFCRIDLV